MQSKIKSTKLEEIWLKAEKHRQASVVGLPLDIGGYELCECCGEVVEK